MISRLQIFAAAALFSTGGAAIKACSLTSWQVASLRSGIAAVAVFLFLPGARRRWSWRTVCVGAAYAATMVLFVCANKLTTAANTIFLQSTAPLYIVLLGPWLLHEWIRRRDAAFMVALAVGLGMLLVGVDPVFASAPDPLSGNILAALSGVTWALTVVGLRWIGKEGGSTAGSAFPAVVAGNVIACIAGMPWALPLSDTHAADWLLLGYLGVFQIGLAYACLTTAIRYVPALDASLLLLLEPVLNPLWAWLIHGERPGAWPLGGGAVILLATAVRAWLDLRDGAAVR